ncbi:unnamed protein product [Mytilus coruscus]|uniref:Uncharacterized protein n=1 Tax=Mytilus coruscus TaxID=42192 RepID=A0A6J8E3N1_MYTCO|nr:unnamed protein product [Mytilus coruscus]
MGNSHALALITFSDSQCSVMKIGNEDIGMLQTGMSQPVVARRFNVCNSTTDRVFQRYRLTGTIKIAMKLVNRKRPYGGVILTPRHRQNRQLLARQQLLQQRNWNRVLFLMNHGLMSDLWPEERKSTEHFADKCVQEQDRFGGEGYNDMERY